MQISTDGMPAQVATELLANPKARLTARMRKTCWDARSKFFVATQQRKPLERKLDAKLSRATWEQLSRWLRRAEHRFLRLKKLESALPEIDNDEPESLTNYRKSLDVVFGQISLLQDRIEAAQAARV